MNTMLRKAILFVLIPIVAHAQDITTPEKHFGHVMGAEGQIIDFHDGLKYYQKLAGQSNRLQYQELGKTTDGNPFVLLIISDPANLQNLAAIKRERQRLSDPRALSEAEAVKLAHSLPAVVFHTSSIHTTEISTAQVIPDLVYTLVSGQDDEVRRTLKNTIVLVSPSANPDGQVKIKKWYDEHKGKPWESSMPWLYHTYVGHDNNRDWILLHFPEQYLTATRIFMEWHPIYSHEMHQMGGNGARIFVPPYQDPYDPNTAPEVMETMAIVGTAMSHRLITEGKSGVVKNAIYDLFTPARAFQIYRGTARVLTETASADFASKRTVRPQDLRGGRGGTGVYDPSRKSWNFPRPWPGGDWTMKEMVAYQLSAALAAINVVAGNPGGFNLAFHRSLKQSMEIEDWPYAFVFPAQQRDASSLARLLRAMQRGRIEVHRAGKAFMADGRDFAAGSHVILLRQPYGAWAKTVLEIQEYPDLRRSPDEPPIVPYDVTAQTLSLMMGVAAYEVARPFQADLALIEDPVRINGMITGSGRSGYLISPNSNEAYAAADALLDAGHSIAQITVPVSVAGRSFPAGSFYVKPGGRGLSDQMKTLAEKWTFRAAAIDDTPVEPEDMHDVANPRIGLYEPWGGVMDAGWTRHVLEQWELESQTLRHSDISGDLRNRYDIIIFPEGISASGLLNGRDSWPDRYRGGIGSEGRDALRRFVAAGGAIATFGRTGMAMAEVLDLPVVDGLAGIDRRQYFAPGSLVLAELDPDSPLAFGLPGKLAVMNRRGPAFAPKATTQAGPRMHARYPNYDPRLSGFLLGPEHLQGKGAIAVQPMGRGRVILFSMNPQFRAMTHGSYKLLFNAIFWSARQAEPARISAH